MARQFNSSIFAMIRAASCILCLSFFLLPGFVPAVEQVAWQADYAAAATKAMQTGKLLLLVQLQSDFTQPPAKSQEAKIYNLHSLSGDQVPVFLNEHFVAAREAVGAPEVLTIVPKSGSPSARGVGGVATWFCTPRGRVIHVVPGYVSPAKMLAEAKWAQQVYAQTAGLPESPGGGFPEAQAEQLRLQQLQRVPKEIAATFQAGLPKTDEPQDARTRAIWQAALAADLLQLQKRFANVWPGNQLPVALTRLAMHGDIRTDAVHLALSEMPLASYRDIHRPVFETLTGAEYWPPSPRRAEIARCFADARRQQQPSLLVVPPDPAFADEPDWATKSLSVSELLPAFALFEITRSELATLLTDVGLEGIIQRENQLVQFVVFDRAGRKAGQLTTRESVQDLAPILKKASAPLDP